jgi:hypothetical protein
VTVARKLPGASGRAIVPARPRWPPRPGRGPSKFTEVARIGDRRSADTLPRRRLELADHESEDRIAHEEVLEHERESVAHRREHRLMLAER